MKIIKLFKFLIILTVLLILAITVTPLSWYYDHVEKQIRPIQLEKINGSAIKGSADVLKYFGLDLGKVGWLLYPGSYDRMSADLTLTHEQYDFSGQYSKAVDTDILKRVNATIDWSIIEKFVKFNHGEMQGYIAVNFDEVRMKNGAFERIVGKAETRGLKLVRPIQKDLGTIEVVFAPENAQIMVGQVNSDSDVINVSGAIYIHKNHKWEVKLTLLPMPGEYEVEYALQSIGDRRPGGGRSLNLAGFY